MKKSLALAGHANPSASEIAAGGGRITGNLGLRCKRESSRRHGFSRGDVRSELPWAGLVAILKQS
jgi:hypothetical protein